jgi:hypothetical protein
LLNINNVAGSAFNDVLTGKTALNNAEAFIPGRGDDTIDGGALSPTAQGIEFNSVSYWEPTNTDPLLSSGLRVDLKAGTASSAYYGNDVLRNIQGVNATRFDDVLLGSDADYIEMFQPQGGNDTIDGRGGNNNNVAYYSAAGPIYGNLALGFVQEMSATGSTLLSTDTLLNIQGLRGSAYNDTLTGRQRRR